MNDPKSLTDNELALSVELQQTRMGLFRQQLRANDAESKLAHLAGEESSRALRALMVEQESREAAKKQPAETPVDPQ